MLLILYRLLGVITSAAESTHGQNKVKWEASRKPEAEIFKLKQEVGFLLNLSNIPFNF